MFSTLRFPGLIYKELFKLFRWYISIWWDGDVYQGTIFGGVAWFGALSLLIGVFQRIVTQSFSSAVFGQSPYQFPFVSMFHSCSLHIPHSRHFDCQVFIFRELLKLFRWPIYVWWDGDVLKVQYLVVWSLIIISGLLCLWALSILIDSTSQRIATMSFSFTAAFGWSS